MLKVDVERQRNRETELQNTYSRLVSRRDLHRVEEKLDDDAPTPPLLIPNTAAFSQKDQLAREE